MTKQYTPFHIIHATVDLESRKTAKDRRLEDEQVALCPDIEGTLRFRSQQKKSLQLLEDLARYLTKNGFAYYNLHCGYRTSKKEWQAALYFGKWQPLADDDGAAQAEASEEILGRFLGSSKPHLNVTVKESSDIPRRHLLRWATCIGLSHVTMLAGVGGQAYCPMGDGERDLAELRAYSERRKDEDVPLVAITGFFLRLLPKEAHGSKNDATLDEALRKMEKPSAEQKWEELMVSLGRTIKCLQKCERLLEGR
ncbi:hypothetical protein BJY01DRAFT_247299 [Aspergillus pseudoustus]|uniref:NADP-dependent oxidoreductase domain-containing protein n=1 Tax=Aspergillus pseudoustus TaxID=1810923 RepID=A0ABR4K281_9EURO